MHERTADELRAWLRVVRRRWQWSAIWRVVARAAAGLALLLWAAWVLVRLVPLGSVPLVLLAAVCVVAGGAFVWIQARRLQKRPSNQQIARFVEERCPELGDLMVTASHRLEAKEAHPFDGLMFQSALTQATALDPDRIVSRSALRKSAITAIALSAAVLAAIVMLRQPAWRAFQTARMLVAPPTLTWEVTPGDARVRVGTPLKVTARLDGLLDGVAPEPASLQVKVGNKQNTVTMTQNGTEYRADLPVDADFQYRVVSGRTASRDYKVDALHPAHVERIDIEYQYPQFTGLKPRQDQDSGDIYGPAGTKVTLKIKTDKPVTSGALAMRGAPSVALTTKSPTETEASLTLDKDGAYRVTLNDVDGLANIDDTEYFIRLMNDRPPDVRILRPSSDRQVTRLEEIAIEARADDDFGVQQLDLVYSVRGGPEHVVPLRKASVDKDETNVDVTHTLYVEDMDVQPGDFITYYARAKDIPRGKRSSESRSDIFFLEVRPYGEEFVAAQSQAAFMGGNSDSRDLIQAQKEIIVATWKVERRSQAGQSEQDIRAIAKAQGELRKRAEQIAATGGIIVNQGQRQHGQGPNPSAAEAKDPIEIAAKEMARAQDSLDALKTGEAIPHEMAAYNQLLKTQAENKQTAVARARGGGSGGQTGTQDLSALFDKELMRQSETNYEQRSTVEQKQDQKQDSALDKLRELARRQDDLARQQQELARQRANLQPEEMKRQLDRLTKEQDDIRKQTEALAQQVAQQQRQNGQQGQSGQQGQQAQNGQQGQSGQQGGGQQGQQGQQSGQQSGQSGQGGQSGQSGQQAQNGGRAGQGQSGQGQQGQSQQADSGLRDAASEMADAAKRLARGDVNSAADSAERTLQRLRDLERQLRGAQPDERKRAMGELQLEAEQMSEAQHRLAADARRLQQQGRSAAASSGDTLRRMAGEQERLAERANALRRSLADLSSSAGTGGKGDQAKAADQDRAALNDAQGELSRQKLEERMRQAASNLRSASGQNGPGPNGQRGQAGQSGQSQNASGQQSQNGQPGQGQNASGQQAQNGQQGQAGQGQNAGRHGQPGQGQPGQSQNAQGQQAGQSGQAGQNAQNGGRQGQPGQGQAGQGQNASGQQAQNGQQGQAGQGQNAGRQGQPGQSQNAQGQQAGQNGQAGQNAQNGPAGQSGQAGHASGEGPDARDMASLAGQQDELARAIDSVAQRLGASLSNNADSRKLSDQLAQVRAHRNRLNELGQRMDEIARQNGGKPGQQGQNAQNGGRQGQQAGQQGQQGQQAGQQGQQAQNGQSGQSGQAGQSGQGGQGGQAGQGGQGGNGQGGNGQGAGDASGEYARLQQEFNRQLRETQELLNGVQRDAQGAGGGGPNGTYGSMGGYTPTSPEANFVRNAPGTEAFKQDYTNWDTLRKDVTLQLEQAETSLAQRLSAKEGRDRLNAGGDDRAPAEYADSVSRYYRSLAKRQQQKQGGTN